MGIDQTSPILNEKNRLGIFNKPSKSMFKIIVYFGLTLFSLFVLYDTNQMLLNYNKNSDVLDSTMNFYLDIINIFSNLFALEE